MRNINIYISALCEMIPHPSVAQHCGALVRTRLCAHSGVGRNLKEPVRREKGVCVCVCVRERVCVCERERETRSLLVHFAVSCGRLLLAWRLVVAQGTLTRWIPKSVPLTCAVRSCHGFRGRIYYPNHTADLSADEWPLYLQ